MSNTHINKLVDTFYEFMSNVYLEHKQKTIEYITLENISLDIVPLEITGPDDSKPIKKTNKLQTFI